MMEFIDLVDLRKLTIIYRFCISEVNNSNRNNANYSNFIFSRTVVSTIIYTDALIILKSLENIHRRMYLTWAVLEDYLSRMKTVIKRLRLKD